MIDSQGDAQADTFTQGPVNAQDEALGQARYNATVKAQGNEPGEGADLIASSSASDAREVLDLAVAQYMLSGMTLQEAVKAAGWPVGCRPGAIFKRIQGRLAAALETVGVTDLALAAKIANGLDCTTLKVVHGASGDVREVSDNVNQARWAELAVAIRGDSAGADTGLPPGDPVPIERRRAHQRMILERIERWTFEAPPPSP